MNYQHEDNLNEFFSQEEIDELRLDVPNLSEQQFETLIKIYSYNKFRPNKYQNKAVTTYSRSLGIMATAGSGKTTVMNIRQLVMHLVYGVPQDQIWAFTFSANAKNSMAARYDRAARKLGLSPAVNFCTFHSFYHLVLTTLKVPFKILPPHEQTKLMKKALSETKTLASSDALNAFKTALTYQHAAQMTTKEMNDSGTLAMLKIDPLVYEIALLNYETLKIEHNGIDYNDLERLCYEKLKNHPAVQNALKSRIKCLFIDEHQDTSSMQAEVIDMVAGDRDNVTVVGDGDQAIYGWRGADDSHLRNFGVNFKNAYIVSLPINYRVPAKILSNVSKMILNNETRYPLQMEAYKDGGQLTYVKYESITDASIYTANKILELIENGYASKLEEIVVETRKKDQAALVIDILLEKNIPIKLTDDTGLFSSSFSVQQCLKILEFSFKLNDKTLFAELGSKIIRYCSSNTVRQIKDSMDGASTFADTALRMPTLDYKIKEEISAVENSLKDIREFLEKDELVAAVKVAGVLLEPYLQFTTANTSMDYDEQQAYLQYLVYKCKAKGYTYQELVSAIALSRALITKYASYTKAVSVMTYHGAKGLEFDHTFVFGLIDSSCPDMNRLKKLNEAHAKEYIESERKAAYVALTRGSVSTTVLYDVHSPSLFITELGVEDALSLFVGTNGVVLDDVPDHLYTSEAEGLVNASRATSTFNREPSEMKFANAPKSYVATNGVRNALRGVLDQPNINQ